MLCSAIGVTGVVGGVTSATVTAGVISSVTVVGGSLGVDDGVDIGCCTDFATAKFGVASEVLLIGCTVTSTGATEFEFCCAIGSVTRVVRIVVSSPCCCSMCCFFVDS